MPGISRNNRTLKSETGLTIGLSASSARAQLSLDWHVRAATCAERWGLSRMQWSPEVSTARVAYCDSPWGPALLKVSVEPSMVGLEAKALAHFGNEMCPALFAVDEELEAILMERIEVLEDLSAWYPNPQKEVDVWLPFYRKVAENPVIPDGFPTLAKYAEIFDRILAEPLREDVIPILEFARDSQEALMGPVAENRLLHGDMHHFNLLRDTGGGWRLIDPHGVVGNPYYELGAFLRNPWGPCYREPGVMQRMSARVAILAERIGIDATKVALYGFYGAAFSVAWSLEEGSDDIDGMVVMADSCLRLL